MALEIDWEDGSTGVTYNNAYVVVDRVVYTKGPNNTYTIHANIHIYKMRRRLTPKTAITKQIGLDQS